ncbi:uncharacterized protein P174DRAFT_439460 [Aspergillus novofumigatus IBT 16806]|uniref:Uncharacterized protein n=1 Tax=Aspergillus novofumigatus (strain IBT 16806) TaxID=1392255 RepID=A0A2I1CJ92_ASPN1|nr:uncharacterized protein P174DRAFT_439460 [Aspergillus novofumigatus IBT 16806]PKX97702.1 hypothetical protein P174DRAFT_439460 [Aspergillus novofumigatus IBT 16806]
MLKGEVLVDWDDSGALSQTALMTAHDYDQQALPAQCMGFPSVVDDTISLAKEKLTQFLAFLDGA